MLPKGKGPTPYTAGPVGPKCAAQAGLLLPALRKDGKPRAKQVRLFHERGPRPSQVDARQLALALW